jgi:hypothetical protein
VGETPVEVSMDDVDVVARINQAVDECLDRCLKSSTPGHLTLDGYCHDLQEDPNWSSVEIDQVRSIVLRLLSTR